MQELTDVKIEYTTEEPTSIVPVGNIGGVHIPKILSQTFLSDKTRIYPSLVQHQGQIKLMFHLSRPSSNLDKGYRIYFLKKTRSIVTYIPIPTHLKPFLTDGRSKRQLINFSIGFDDKNHLFILLERFKNG